MGIATLHGLIWFMQKQVEHIANHSSTLDFVGNIIIGGHLSVGL